MFYQLPLDEVYETVPQVLERVNRNANEEWKEKAWEVMQHVCKTMASFTSDSLWHELQKENVHTHEPRAIAAIIMRAAREGLCEPTDNYIKSSRPVCHKRPLRLWLSTRQSSSAAYTVS
jgi:hypothetical protein